MQNKTGKKQVFEWTPSLRTAIKSAKKQERGQTYTSSGFKSNWQRLMINAIKNGASKIALCCMIYEQKQGVMQTEMRRHY